MAPGALKMTWARSPSTRTRVILPFACSAAIAATVASSCDRIAAQPLPFCPLAISSSERLTVAAR